MDHIILKEVKKEFKITKRHSGLKGSIRDLFFREYKTVKAVDGISLNIAHGEIVGYLGPNGAGKSTTIKMMAGILEPTSGSVMVNGIVPYKNRVKNASNIGVVFGQRSQLNWSLPVIESYKLLKEMYRISDKDYKNNIELFNSIIKKNELFECPVRQLSLGQRVLCDIMGTFLHDPSVVFLDEPTIGLDVSMKAKIRDLIRVLNKEKNTTIILTTHDMGDVEALCKRTVIIDKGKVLYNGDIDSLKSLFGQHRAINLSFFKNTSDASIDEYQLLKSKIELELNDNFSAPFEIVFNNDSMKFSIIIDEEQISAIDVINCVQKKHKLVTLSIDDVSIEDVVRKIYERENSEKVFSFN